MGKRHQGYQVPFMRYRLASRRDIAESLRIRHLDKHDLLHASKITWQEIDVCQLTYTVPELVRWLSDNRGFNTALVAEYEGLVLGLIMYSSDPSRQHVTITGLWVSRLFRRIGIGSSLLSHAFASIKHPHGKIRVFVSERADAGLLFLRSKGFVATEIMNGGQLYRLEWQRQAISHTDQTSLPTG
jgi:ribosomal protein S18 acetylase RimI-like enzyme